MLPIAAVLIWASSARAQPDTVSFAQARAAAEQLAPDVVVAMERTSVSRAGIRVAGAWANPSMTVQTATQTARLGTMVSVPLPVFGQRGKAVAAARADARVSAADTRVVRAEVRAQATLAWIELWAAQQRARLLEAAAVAAERLQSIAQELFDTGSGPRVDVVRSGAGASRARASVLQAGAAVRAAAARLSVWLGRGEPGEVTAAGDFGYPATLPALGALLQRQAGHPALRRDQAVLFAAEAHIAAERRARFPIVSVELGANAFDPTLPRTDFIAGLSFELPLFNQNGGAIERARAEHALASVERQADALRLRAELEAGYREAEGALSQLQALQREAVPALQQARDMTEEAYRAGRVDLLRLLDAQSALLDAELAQVDAQVGWARAVAELERALGVSLTTAEATRAP